MPSHSFTPHDHAICAQNLMEAAETRCRSEGLRLTETRKRVLSILLNDHKALGAYDILDLLTQEGKRPQPPVVYRALDFLVKNGLAHRIEKLNAYTACTHSGHPHLPAFLICRDCRAVAEHTTQQTQDSISQKADSVGFHVEQMVIEAEGLCPDCQPEPQQ